MGGASRRSHGRSGLPLAEASKLNSPMAALLGATSATGERCSCPREARTDHCLGCALEGVNVRVLPLGHDPRHRAQPSAGGERTIPERGSDQQLLPVASLLPLGARWVRSGPGTVVEFSPWLFLAIGSLCLLSGCILQKP